jgi:hypothetical protein
MNYLTLVICLTCPIMSLCTSVSLSGLSLKCCMKNAKYILFHFVVSPSETPSTNQTSFGPLGSWPGNFHCLQEVEAFRGLSIIPGG